MKDRLAQLPAAVVGRRDPEDHVRIDCDFSLDGYWQSQAKPAFFYGIAHVLRHSIRKAAFELCSESTPPHADSRRRLLRRSVGWADEFYWLAIWSATRKLKGEPQLEDHLTQHDRFFLALADTEWADLLREAALFALGGIIPTGNDGDSFGVWSTRQDRDLRCTLAERARSRFNVAERFVKGITEKSLQTALKDIGGHLALGLLRLEHLERAVGAVAEPRPVSETRTLAEEARRWAGDDEHRREFVNCVEGSVTGDVDARRQVRVLFAHENEQVFEPIHLLARWIVDLLGNEDRPILHPRISLPKDDPEYGTDVTTFPNREMIIELEEHLQEHRDWLRFVSGDGIAGEGAVFSKNLESIFHSQVEFEAKAFSAPSQPGPSDPNVRRWELLVLRDWASYTPLLPPMHHAGARALGGGYFIRHNQVGIVVDPGFDFIENFYEAGLTPDLITDVVVTHDHYDHAASLGPLLNLIHADRKSPGPAQQMARKVNFFLSRGVFDQYGAAIVDLGYYGRVEPITDQDDCGRHEHRLTDYLVSLGTTHTEHGSPEGFGKGVGVVFDFGEGLPKLGLTSDTGWYDEYRIGGSTVERRSLGEVFNDLAPEVMLLHVGSLKLDELEHSKFYKTHLGARGVFRTVEAVKSCRLALLSEFGEECRGYRAWFADQIDAFFRSPERKGSKFRCFSTDRRTRVVATSDGLTIGDDPSTPPDLSYLEAESEETPGGGVVFRRDRESAPPEEQG